MANPIEVDSMENDLEALSQMFKKYVELKEKFEKSFKIFNITLYDENEKLFENEISSRKNEMKCLGHKFKSNKKELFIYGSTSAGKSTFINCLLERELSKNGCGVTTQNLIRIQKSNDNQERIEIDGIVQQYTTDLSKQIQINRPNPESTTHPISPIMNKTIDVFINSPDLDFIDDDLIICDSPGIDASTDVMNIVKEKCKTAHLIVLVIDSVSTISDQERNCIDSMFRNLDVFIVYNQWDRITNNSDSVRDSHITNATELLEIIGVPENIIDNRIHFISSKDYFIFIENSKREEQIFEEIMEKVVNNINRRISEINFNEKPLYMILTGEQIVSLNFIIKEFQQNFLTNIIPPICLNLNDSVTRENFLTTLINESKELCTNFKTQLNEEIRDRNWITSFNQCKEAIQTELNRNINERRSGYKVNMIQILDSSIEEISNLIKNFDAKKEDLNIEINKSIKPLQVKSKDVNDILQEHTNTFLKTLKDKKSEFKPSKNDANITNLMKKLQNNMEKELKKYIDGVKGGIERLFPNEKSNELIKNYYFQYYLMAFDKIDENKKNEIDETYKKLKDLDEKQKIENNKYRIRKFFEVIWTSIRNLFSDIKMKQFSTEDALNGIIAVFEKNTVQVKTSFNEFLKYFNEKREEEYEEFRKKIQELKALLDNIIQAT